VTGPVRRVVAAVASTVVAMFGFASVATAAQTVPATNVATTNAEIQSYGICDSSTGEWVITWKFLNTDTASDATLTNVAPTVATALPNIDNGAVVAKQTTLSGVQRLTAGTNTAGLSVDAAWSSGAATVIGSWNSGAKTCTNNNDCAPLAKGVFTHSFNGPAGSAQVSRSGNQPYPALCAAQRLTLVSYYALSASFALPQYVFDYTTQDFTPLTYELTFQIALPPCFTQVDFVTGERINPLNNSSGLYGDRKIGSANGTGSYSIGPQGWYNGKGANQTGGVCTNPAATATPLCDGSGSIHLSNGLSAEFANVTFQVKKNGDAIATPYTVAPNTSTTFTVIDGQWPVEVQSSNGFQVSLPWTWPASGCEQPTLLVEPDCSNLVLSVTNPNSKTINVTASYAGTAQTKPIGKGASTAFTFPAATGSAIITIDGASGWTPFTTTFNPAASCRLADTGTSVTTVVVIGVSLAAAGAALIYVVARAMGRRRRTA
jgi:hypothetical protein